MKVNCNRDISFKNLYTNKTLKKGLEFASDYSALFATSTATAFSIIRPISIAITPNTEKENRQLAILKSISSSFIGLGIMVCASVPLSNAVKKIDKNQKKYLNNKTIENLKEKGKSLEESKPYIMATQMFKLGLSTLTAIPKSLCTALGTLYLANMLGVSNDSIKKNQCPKDRDSCANGVSFKGKDKKSLSGLVAQTINKNKFQEFAKKYKDSNFPMHIMAGADTLATGAFIWQINKNNTIKEDKKNTLIANAVLSTTLCISSGYIVDKLLEKPTDKFIRNYKKLNKNQPNLEKQVQGIKIAKPVLILGSIYYVLIPFISTFFAEFADKKSKYNPLNKIHNH